MPPPHRATSASPAAACARTRLERTCIACIRARMSRSECPRLPDGVPNGWPASAEPSPAAPGADGAKPQPQQGFMEGSLAARFLCRSFAESVAARKIATLEACGSDSDAPVGAAATAQPHTRGAKPRERRIRGALSRAGSPGQPRSPMPGTCRHGEKRPQAGAGMPPHWFLWLARHTQSRVRRPPPVRRPAALQSPPQKQTAITAALGAPAGPGGRRREGQ